MSALAQLGDLVRRLRGERGLTLMNLGELTGYSWQHLSAVERGDVVPSEAVAVACERALAAGGQLAGALALLGQARDHLDAAQVRDYLTAVT